jgi:cell division protein FtsW (lipid II flippase)
MAALLTAVGVTMIYRLDRGRRRSQALWVVIGVGVFALTLFLLRATTACSRATSTSSASPRSCCCCCPRCRDRQDGQRRTALGRRRAVQFQPGELAKIFLIVFLAGYLRDKREVLAQGRLKDLGPLLVIWGAPCWCSSRRATSAARSSTSGSSWRCSTSPPAARSTSRRSRALPRRRHLRLPDVSHVQDRVTIWLQPWTDHPVFCAQTGGEALRQDCGSFQLVKSLYSIANGGFGGTGLGRGHVHHHLGRPDHPYLNTDFIYSAIAQELGLIGACGVLLVFMLFVTRGMRIALLAQDGFSKLLAAGLTFGFALQTFIIVGGVLRVIPLTGITLPFVSYGGSSVVANFVLLALLLLVSNRANAVGR